MSVSVINFLLSLIKSRAVSCTLMLVSVLMASSANAETIDNLYQVSVPVASQSGKELRRASSEGLATAFVRVSGNAAAVNEPGVRQAIRSAQKFTRQFRYESKQLLPAIESVEDQETVEQIIAVLDFEPELVNKTLREAGLALWSANRPSVLVWMAIGDADGRRFVGTETDAQIVTAINESATRRGLPVKLPALDLEDMVALTVDDVWQMNASSVLSAAERYGADSLLIGKVSQLSNGEWLGSWQFLLNSQRVLLDGQATNAEDYIATGLDQVAELLARQYAIVPADITSGGILLRLSGINSFVDYARAIAYLESVSAVHHANVVSIEGDDLIIRLVADGLLPQLQQAFALDKTLQAATNVYQGSYTIELDYRWPPAS